MKRYFTFLFCLLSFEYKPANANNNTHGNGNISGHITTSEGQPAVDARVEIINLNRSTTTNNKGAFFLKNIPAGQHRLRITLLGHETIFREVSVESGITTVLSIQLENLEMRLKELIVQDNRNNMTNKNSDYVARLPLNYLENPQSFSIATKELLLEKNVTDYQSAVRSIPGIALSTEDYQGSSVAYVRGFAVNPYIRNGIYYMNLVAGDPQNIERLEAIKGPSGTLYGSQGVSYGGLINRVTKKPFATRAGEAGITLGGFGLTRLTVDYNTPLKADTSILLRLNAAATWQQSFQDNGYQKSYLVAPSFYYRINDKLNVLVDVELNSSQRPALTSYPVYSATGYARYDDIPLDYYKTYGSDKAGYPPSTTHNFYTQLNYKLTNKWRISANIAYADFNFNSGTIGLTLQGKDTLLRDLYDFYWQYNSVDIQPNLNGEFNLGPLNNKLLIGLDYQNIKTLATGYSMGPQDTINFKKPFPSFPITRIRASEAYSNSYFEMDFKQKTYAAYITDVINFNDRLNLMLSLRYDHYRDGGYTDRAAPGTSLGPDAGSLAPKLGVTYQLIKGHLTFFADYMQGINYVAPDMAGHVFVPERARQSEGGLKLELSGGKLSSTISYYSILVKDKVRTDPSNPNISIQDGTQESKGVDIDIIARPATGLNIILGYGYNVNKYLKSDAGLEGKRPYGTPPNTGNLWTSYTFPHGTIKGLGIGTGVVYSDDYFGTDENTLIIPGYIVWNGNIFYNTSKFRISLGLDNIGKQRYWDMFGTPQMPRKLTASMIFRF